MHCSLLVLLKLHLVLFAKYFPHSLWSPSQRVRKELGKLCRFTIRWTLDRGSISLVFVLRDSSLSYFFADISTDRLFFNDISANFLCFFLNHRFNNEQLGSREALKDMLYSWAELRKQRSCPHVSVYFSCYLYVVQFHINYTGYKG